MGRAACGWLLAASLSSTSSCKRHESSTPSVTHPVTIPPRVVVDAAMIEPEGGPRDADGGGALDYADAVRHGRWREAWEGLEALSDTEKARPEVQYVRARVALARGDAATAIALLEGAESSLPLLADEVLRFRAEAKLIVGPHLEAADYFVGRLNPKSQLKASEAYEKGGDLLRAKYACDRVILHEKCTRAEEANARERRLRLAGGAADARWLATHAPDLIFGKDAEKTLVRIDPEHPLTTQDLVLRAQSLADAGRTDEALRTLELIPNARGDKQTPLSRLRAKGDVLYRGRDHYLEAARVLGDAAAVGGKDAAEDAFRSARALSRADHDDEAIVAYNAVARRYARTHWGDEAAYYAPYLHYLHGHWREAVRGFDDYLKRHPSGAERNEARHHHALSLLLAKDYKEARKRFEELADDSQNDPIFAARARTMSALASLRDGDRIHASALWTGVARSLPLTWPALIARLRLSEAGLPIPPLIEQDTSGGGSDGWSPRLPPPIDVLHRIGLDEDAERFLRDRENLVAAAAPGRAIEALCAAYGIIGQAKFRYRVATQIPAALLAIAPTARNEWAWDCAFPQPYSPDVETLETVENIPAGLVYAVMRHESHFDPGSVSNMRAVGLMQIVPETARATATHMAIPFEPESLSEPFLNIAIGAHYLRRLLEHFDGRVVLAVAAYNAGPDPIDRWLRRSADLELDTFVERIPYGETRAYTVAVVGNYLRYAFRYTGKTGAISNHLSLGPAPSGP